MIELPRPLSRLLALVLLAAVAAAVWFAGIAPLSDRIARTQQAAADNRALIARLEQRLSGRGAYDRQIELLIDRIDQSGIYIRAETEPLAAARVQEHLTRIIERAGAELRSVQSLPSEEEDDLTRIGVRVMMRGDYAPLISILHGLETGEPFLFIDNVQMKMPSARRRNPQAQAGQRLSVVFDLFGYLPPQVSG